MRLIFGGIGIIVLNGCTAYEATTTTHFAREFMTQDLEDQIMFNLIRAKNGIPFEQYDVQNLQSVVTQSLAPSGSAGSTSTTNRYPLVNSTVTNTGPTGGVVSQMLTTTLGAATAAVQTVIRPYSLNVAATRQSALTAVINPINNDPSVYAAYAKFLNFGHKTKKREDAEDEDTAKLKPSQETTITQTALDRLGEPIPILESAPGGTPKEKKDENGNVLWRPISQRAIVSTASPPKAKVKISYFGINVLTVCCGKTPPQDRDCYIKHTLRLWEGDYYWIPSSYVPQFAELWMALVARKPPTARATTSTEAVKSLRLQNLNSTNQATGIFGQ